jgi:hypothetical protein
LGGGMVECCCTPCLRVCVCTYLWALQLQGDLDAFRACMLHMEQDMQQLPHLLSFNLLAHCAAWWPSTLSSAVL